MTAVGFTVSPPKLCRFSPQSEHVRECQPEGPDGAEEMPAGRAHDSFHSFDEGELFQIDHRPDPIFVTLSQLSFIPPLRQMVEANLPFLDGRQAGQRHAVKLIDLLWSRVSGQRPIAPCRAVDGR